MTSDLQRRIVFAAAPSQDDFLAALVLAPEIRWDQIAAFHMDEYLGLGPDGCFSAIEDVPTEAITLTIPTLMSARHLSIVVRLFLDEASASKLSL